MFEPRKNHLIAVALALAFGTAGVIAGTEAAAGKAALQAAETRIETQAKAQRTSCERLQGNAKDVCQAEAEGRRRVAEAQLEARQQPGPQAEKIVKFARADAGYQVAKQRCAALKGRPRTLCIDRAKAEREAATRLAKVEKVEEVNALKRAGQPRETPRPPPRS